MEEEHGGRCARTLATSLYTPLPEMFVCNKIALFNEVTIIPFLSEQYDEWNRKQEKTDSVRWRRYVR